MSGTAKSPIIQNFASFVNGVKVGFIADPAHLLKSIRNNFQCYKTLILCDEEVQKYNLPTNVVDFAIVEELVKFMENHELPIACKLNQAVLDKGRDSYGKMDVGTAIKLFHRDTSYAIIFLIENYGYDEKYRTTAHYIFQVAHWYDIMSCRGKELAFERGNAEKNARLESFLVDFMIFFPRMKVHKNGQMFPFQRGVLLTTKTILWLQEEVLKNEEVVFFSVGRVIADVIESHHGQMRLKQINPTPREVKRFTKLMVMSQFMHRVNKGSYGDDDSEFLTEFKDFKKLQEEELDDSEEKEDLEHFVNVKFDPEDFENWSMDQIDQFAEANALSYFAGYILYKTKMCKSCKSKLVCKVTQDTLNDQVVNNLIVGKEWKLGCLTRPTKLANVIFHTIEGLFKCNRHLYLEKKDIQKSLVDFLTKHIKANVEEVPHCCLEKIINRFMRGRLHFWAKFINEQGKEVNDPIALQESMASKSSRAKTIDGLK